MARFARFATRYYLPLIVITAVLVGGVWIASAIAVRHPGSIHALPVTSKVVARSVVKVLEAWVDDARLGILLAPATAERQRINRLRHYQTSTSYEQSRALSPDSAGHETKVLGSTH